MVISEEQKEKIAQVVRRFVDGHKGRRVGYTKVLKLLYILDRESLRKWGFTVTADDYESLKNGPVLKDTRTCLRHKSISDSVFKKYIQKDVSGYIVPTESKCEYDEVSQAEVELIDNLLHRYGTCTTESMIEITHTFAEWKETGGSNMTISIESMASGAIRDQKAASGIARSGQKDRALGRVLV